MNKKVIVENLEQLIEEHKKEKIPYETYKFDSASYTLLLIDINKLKNQLEEKDKVIDEAIKYMDMVAEIGSYNNSKSLYGEDFDELYEILERGKNGK